MEQPLEDFYASLRTPVSILESFLHDVKPLTTGWVAASCPFHEDKNPSFSIHQSSGNWKCHSCQKTGSFFDLPGNPGEPTPTAVYSYAQENLTKYLKVRYFPKTFKFFSVTDGYVSPGKSGSGDLLYNWDYVKTKSGDVYIVEGEKDVDNLTAMGVLAVTGGGASNWHHSFAELLSKRIVYLIPDNDEAGVAWTQRVCKTLKPAGILLFPDRNVKDISEWFERGNKFSGLIRKQPEQCGIESSTDEIIELHSYTEPIREPDILKTLIPRNYVSVLYGDGGEGKSLIALSMAHHVVAGLPFMGLETSKVKTLYLDWELDIGEHVRRSYKLCRGIGLLTPPAGLYYSKVSGSFRSVIHNIRPQIQREGIEFLIVDSMGAACCGDVNSSSEIIGLFSSLLSLGVTVLVIDHISKSSQFGDITKPFGSVYKFNMARSVVHVKKTEPKENGMLVQLSQFKNNISGLSEPIKIEFTFSKQEIVMNFRQNAS